MYGRYGYTLALLSKIGAAVPPAPAFITQPTISGGAGEGALLTCDPGTFSNGAVSLIEWQRGGQPILGAVGATYQREPADVGQTIRAHVVIVGAGGSAEAFTGDAAATVGLVNKTTFANYDGVTLNGATGPLRAGNYSVPLRGDGIGQGALASTTNNGQIAGGSGQLRAWSIPMALNAPINLSLR
jgi:hypothetical protein